MSEASDEPKGAAAEMPMATDSVASPGLTIGQLEQRIEERIDQIGKGGIDWTPPQISSDTTNAGFAIELRIDDNGAEVLDISPTELLPSSPGEEPTLNLRALDQQGNVLFQTVLADPRMVEIEGQEWRRLDSGTLSVTVPAEEGLSELVLQPTQTPGQALEMSEGIAAEAEAEKGMRVELNDALSQLCEGYQTLEACAAQ